MNKNSIEYENVELISLKDIKKEFNERKATNKLPKDYRVKFPIIRVCRYCHFPFVVFYISFFNDYCVCNCPRCGGRHKVSNEDMKSYTFFRIICILIIIVVALFLIIDYYLL